MKTKLRPRDYVCVASMLFGMFFGAGNLIFPVSLGQNAGSGVWAAFAGLLITGVGLPLLGVAALGISRSEGLYDLASKAGRPYGLFFTCLLYLTIGPFFAIPRCATTSFTVGLEQLLPQGEAAWLYLLLFTAAFFGTALFFSLRPGKILVWIGKILNPFFLLFLGILVITALLNPAAAVSEVEPLGGYASEPFFTGFLEGYNTMDALASLAFGIVVVQTIRGLGVDDPQQVAGSTVRSGIFSCLFMGLIYGGDDCRHTEPGVIRACGERRHCAGADCAALLRRCGATGICGDGHFSLSEDGGRADYELCGDVHGDFPEGAELQALGNHFQRGVVFICEHGVKSDY